MKVLKRHRWAATTAGTDKKYDSTCEECYLRRTRQSGQWDTTYTRSGAGRGFLSAAVPDCEGGEPDDGQPFELEGRPF